VRRRRSRGASGLLVSALALLAVLVALVAGAPPAQAHAFLTGSNPADGAVLEAAPSVLTLRFSERVLLSGSLIEVTDSSGRVLAVGVPQLSPVPGATPPGAASPGAGPGAGVEEPQIVSVALPPLARGSYRVSWSMISSDDLHPAAGVLVFGVQESVTAQGWVETAPSGPEAGLRWLVLLGIAGGIGAPLARSVVRRAGCGAVDLAVTDRAAAAVGAVAALAAAVLLLDQLSAAPGALGDLVTGGYAVRWGVREVGLLLLVASAARHRGGGTRAARLLLAAGVSGSVLGTALLGHSGSGLLASPTTLAAASLHLLSTACWMGTLAMLVLVIVRRRPGPTVVRALLVTFGAPAAAAVSVTVATGTYLASGVVGSVDAALLTDYGRALLLKVVLVAVCGGLALVTRRRLRRSLRPVGRLVAAELGVGVVVLALTGVLTSGQPALEPQLVGGGPVSSTPSHQRVGDLEESFALKPSLPGDNVVILEVASSRRPAPGPLTAVSVSVVGPDAASTPPVAAAPIGDGRWSAPISVSGPGPLTVRVAVSRAGLAPESTDYAWGVGRPGGAPTPLVSRAPLSSGLTWAAVGVSTLLALLWVGRLRRRRPPAGGPPGGAFRPLSAQGDDELGQQGSHDEGRQEVADGNLANPQQPQGDADQHEPARRGEGGDVGVRQDRAEQHAHQGEQALDHGDGHRGDEHADPERRRERHRRETVQDGLETQLLDPAAQPVREAAEDRQGPDAEQQRGRQPALDEALAGRRVRG